MKKRLLAILLVLNLFASMIPAALAAQEAPADFKGKMVSVIGDSISTFGSVSNNTAYNPTIGGNAVFYAANGGTYSIGVHDTWWQQAIDALEMELCVNNSWSGSRISQDGSGPAAYKDRCVQLHNAQGQDPDYIWVYLGTNDYSYHILPWGTAEAIDEETLFAKCEDGAYAYPAPATVCEAYAIMLHKSMIRYPEAEIYCLGMLTRTSVDAGLSSANDELEGVATLLEIPFVELESITADPTDFNLTMGDALHPKGEGMDRIAQRLINAMLGKEDHRELEVYDITYDLKGVGSSNDAMLSFDGGRYETILSAPEGDSIDAVVTMGGVDITETCFEDGKILIPEVTGAISVTARASAMEVEIPEIFEDPVDTWEELMDAQKKRVERLCAQVTSAAADIGDAVEDRKSVV